MYCERVCVCVWWEVVAMWLTVVRSPVLVLSHSAWSSSRYERLHSYMCQWTLFSWVECFDKAAGQKTPCGDTKLRGGFTHSNTHSFTLPGSPSSHSLASRCHTTHNPWIIWDAQCVCSTTEHSQLWNNNPVTTRCKQTLRLYLPTYISVVSCQTSHFRHSRVK